MGVIVEALRRTFARQSSLPQPAGDPWGFRWVLPRERDYFNDVGDGANSNLVVPAIDFIANGFIEAPVKVSEQQTDEFVEVANFGMTDLLRRPNPFYSGALLWMPTIANWIADGNAYWIISAFAAAGRPAELYWVPSWTMEPKAPQDGSVFLSHYRYEPGAGRPGFDLDPQQVVHFRWGLDATNPRKGFSRLKQVLREIYSDEEAARFTATLLRKVGVPGGVLSPKGDVSITPTEAADVKADVTQKTTGDHRGEWLVMTSATDMQQWGFSPEQMDLAALRAIPESRVAAALGIPAAVLGFLAGMEQTKVGATMAELRELAYEQGIIPKMRLFTEELATQLLPHYTDAPDRFKVEFDLSDVRVLQEDENKHAQRIGDLVQRGVIKRAEGRNALGYDSAPEDEVYHLPVNVIEVGPGAQPAALPGNVRPIAASRQMARKATREQLAYLRATDRSGQRMSVAFARDLERAFDELGQMAAAAWQELPQRFARDPEDEAIVRAIAEVLVLEDWRISRLEPLWRRHYLRVAEFTYDAMRSHLTVDVGVNLPDRVGVRVVAAGGRNLGLVDLDVSTRNAIFEALSQARAEGAGPVEAARRIRRYVSAGRFTAMEAEKPGAGVRYRSELIARTETLHAQRVAVAEAGEAAGFTRYLAFDNRTGFGDEECTARDGREFTYDEVISISADEHPNGTLSWTPVPASQAVA